MKKIYQLFMIVVMMGMTPVLTSCDEIIGEQDNPVTPKPSTDPENPTEITVQGITITGFVSDAGATASTTVTVGTKLKLAVAIEPAEITDFEVVWKSGNEKIVKVSADGTITAVAVGEATVTVSLKSDPKLSATLTIKVVEEEQDDPTTDNPTTDDPTDDPSTDDPTSDDPSSDDPSSDDEGDIDVNSGAVSQSTADARRG